MSSSKFPKLARLLDQLRFRLETTNYILDKPTFDYQPLPWVGIDDAGVRGQATKERWQVMKEHFPKAAQSLKDIGCCVGYFCIAGAEELGLKTFGIDNNDQFLRMGRLALPDRLQTKCNFIYLSIDASTIKLVPQTDITLVLSIWHHWVYDYGLNDATNILKNLWQSTNQTMMFESGEEEIAEEFNMPFTGPSARVWLSDYLKKNLEGAEVTEIGAFPAGDYPHYQIKGHKRTIFKLTRKA